MAESSIGVTVAIAGNMLISMALNIQKHVHNSLTSKPDEEEPLLDRSPAPQGMEPREEDSYITQPLWWLGMVLMMLGELGNFAAYGYAPAVLVAPLGTVALITNAVVAPCFLGERLRAQDVFGIGFSILGTIVIVLVSSDTAEPNMSFNDVLLALSQFQFISYIILTVILLANLLYLSDTPRGSRYIWIDLSIVAIFGGYTVLSTKALSSLFKLELHMVFTHWITYLLILILASTAVLQMKFLNRALSRFDSVQVIPTNFVFFTTSSIIGSSVLYHDLQRTSPMSLMGVLCMFLGVLLITSRAEDTAVPPNVPLLSTPPNEPSDPITIHHTPVLGISQSAPMHSPRKASHDTLRRVSNLFEPFGTHQVRKLELDLVSEIGSPERRNQ